MGGSQGSYADFGDFWRFLTLNRFQTFVNPQIAPFGKKGARNFGQMDDHVRFNGTKYEKGNNNTHRNRYKCGENCNKIMDPSPSPPRLGHCLPVEGPGKNRESDLETNLARARARQNPGKGNGAQSLPKWP